ncbi:MAG: SDR family oxidoreductase [Deltaproteobacteria bacterium]|nr:SDR family oxidoreductase [Deltaproteobacteria bacterium]MBW2398562.1 SDR family oxidoreductase [Deltaproteobacteria bacterium]MBW2665620.1 SDR family oxidoreductase [Deltaproteobacteria bacterium]
MARGVRESLQGRSVLITGAASGIGRAAAARFHTAGARVTLLDRAEDRLAETAAEIADAGTEPPLALPCDLLDHEARAAAVARTLDARGAIDVLINNAGLVMGGPFHEGDPARMHDLIEVNLCASLHLSRLVLPMMIARGSGHVVNVISSGATLGIPGFAVYAATKSGLISATRVLRRELTGTGVRITTLCPGSTTSGMTRAMLEHGKGPAMQPHHPPEVPAAALLDAVERGLEHVVVTHQPRRVALASFLDRLFPHLLDRYWERQVTEDEWLESARHSGL